MINAAAYQRFIVLFRRMKYLGVAVALLGLALGFAAAGSARVVIWVISGLLATWTFIIGFFQERRYQRFLDSLQLRVAGDDSGSPRDIRSLRLSSGLTVKRDSPLAVPIAPQPIPQSGDSEREARRVAAMRGFESQFTGIAVVFVAMSVTGIILAFSYWSSPSGCDCELGRRRPARGRLLSAG